jgi:hypothetical protein
MRGNGHFWTPLWQNSQHMCTVTPIVYIYIQKGNSNFVATRICCKYTDIPRLQHNRAYIHSGLHFTRIYPKTSKHQRLSFLDSISPEYASNMQISQDFKTPKAAIISGLQFTRICCKYANIPRLQNTKGCYHFWTPFHQNKLQICRYVKTSNHQSLRSFLDSISPEYAENMQISQDFKTPKTAIISGLHFTRICCKYAEIPRIQHTRGYTGLYLTRICFKYADIKRF